LNLKTKNHKTYTRQLYTTHRLSVQFSVAIVWLNN